MRPVALQWCWGPFNNDSINIKTCGWRNDSLWMLIHSEHFILNGMSIRLTINLRLIDLVGSHEYKSIYWLCRLTVLYICAIEEKKKAQKHQDWRINPVPRRLKSIQKWSPFFKHIRQCFQFINKPLRFTGFSSQRELALIRGETRRVMG